MRLNLDTLAGIMRAQKKLDELIPVISSRQGLLQEIQARLLNINREECIELMNALITLQSHCRALGYVEFELTVEERKKGGSDE
jgi:hypothetical protein